MAAKPWQRFQTDTPFLSCATFAAPVLPPSDNRSVQVLINDYPRARAPLRCTSELQRLEMQIFFIIARYTVLTNCRTGGPHYLYHPAESV